MDKKIEEIGDTLKKYGQEHLLNHYDSVIYRAALGV